MAMLPQSPPNAPPPPQPEAAILSRRKRRWLWIVGVTSILVALIGSCVLIRRKRNDANVVEATSNLRSMSLALHEFEMTYGAFPNEGTRGAVVENTGNSLPSGTRSSNDYFRQLIASEICMGEVVFYANIPGSRKPDDCFSGEHMLEKGEVGFSYIVGLSSKGHPARPLVVTPLIPGTNRFDPKPFNGYAIILPVDGTITRTGPPVRIDENGEVVDSSGKHILDPANPMWGGIPPVIAWPE